MAFLLRVNQTVSASREAKEFWQQLMKGLSVSNPDVPFALLYSASGDADETMSISSGVISNFEDWDLEGSVAVPEHLVSGWKNLRADINEVEDFIPNFKTLVRSESPTLLRIEDGSLPEVFSREIPIAGGIQPCEAAVFLPIRSPGEYVLGFLIIGINPRKRYDEDYDILVQLLSRQLATSMAVSLPFGHKVVDTDHYSCSLRYCWRMRSADRDSHQNRPKKTKVCSQGRSRPKSWRLSRLRAVFAECRIWLLQECFTWIQKVYSSMQTTSTTSTLIYPFCKITDAKDVSSPA